MANYRPASFALFNQIFVSGIFEETVGSVFFVIINESAAWLSPATALLTSVLIKEVSAIQYFFNSCLENWHLIIRKPTISKLETGS